MALILCLGVGLAAFAALHKLHFRPIAPEVKRNFVRRNITGEPLVDQLPGGLLVLAHPALENQFAARPRFPRCRTAPKNEESAGRARDLSAAFEEVRGEYP